MAVADSMLPCFTALGDQTANQLRDRFQQGLTQLAVEEHVERLIETSLGSNWTRLYDSVSRISVWPRYTPLINAISVHSISITRNLYCNIPRFIQDDLCRLQLVIVAGHCET